VTGFYAFVSRDSGGVSIARYGEAFVGRSFHNPVFQSGCRIVPSITRG